MALEINEIGIRVRVDDGGMNTPVQLKEKEESIGNCREASREEIVEDCVRRVLQILRSREER
jgi:hypothetical protein